MLKTKACVMLAAGEKIDVHDIYLSEDEMRSDQCLVEFQATGICNTDIATWDGKLPHAFPCVLGHEGVGIVRRLPSGYQGELHQGDRVVCSWNACDVTRTDTVCTACAAGNCGGCHNFLASAFAGVQPDGATTQYYLDGEKTQPVSAGFFGQSSLSHLSFVSLQSAIKVDSTAPAQFLSPLSCGFLTGMGGTLRCLSRIQQPYYPLPSARGLSPADVAGNTHDFPAMQQTVAVFGIGAVGISAVRAAKIFGATTIVAIDMVESRLQLARQAGATQTLLAGVDDVVDVVQQIKSISHDGKGATLAIEASGALSALQHALACLAPLGCCASIGVIRPGLQSSVDANAMTTYGLTYTGILMGNTQTQHLIPYMAKLLEHGHLDIIPQIVTTYTPDEINQAFDDAKSGKVIKPVILWS